MALFKKQGAASAPETQETGASPDANGAFDFDAIARDLEATNGAASPLDELLSQPAKPTSAVSSTDSSLLDFPASSSPAAANEDLDPLGFNSIPTAPTRPTPPRPLQVIPPVAPVAPTTPQTPPVQAPPIIAANDDDDPLGLSQFDAPPSPIIPPAQSVVAPPPVSAPPAPVPPAPAAPSAPVPSSVSFLYPSEAAAPAAKKKLPVLPIVGILAFIGVASYGAFYFLAGTHGDQEPPIPVPQTSTKGGVKPGGAPSSAPNMGAKSGAGAPGKPLAAGSPATSGAQPTIPLTPKLQTQLKALWKQGAAAKQAHDYAGARKYWQQALKLRPNHPGIQEAIDKLPPAGPSR